MKNSYDWHLEHIYKKVMERPGDIIIMYYGTSGDKLKDPGAVKLDQLNEKWPFNDDVYTRYDCLVSRPVKL